MIDSKIVANRMTPQPRRRIDPLVHDSYHRYAPWTTVPPGLACDAPGRHAHLESIISLPGNGNGACRGGGWRAGSSHDQ